MSSLEVKIRDKMQFFQHRKQALLPSMKEDLQRLRSEFEEASFQQAPRDWYDLRDRVASLDKEVQDVESDREMHEYLLDIIPFVRMAYDSNAVQDSEEEDVGRHVPDTLKAAVQVSKVVRHGTTYSRYLVEVEKAPAEPRTKREPVSKAYSCGNCGGYDVVDETASSAMICRTCAAVTTYLGDTRANLTYEQDCDLDHTKAFSYKKISRYNEIISQFQARQNVEIPDEVIGQLKAELKKLRLKRSSDITPKKVKQLLKKLDMQKYYSCTVQICKELGGDIPPTMTPELEDKLRQMFLQTLDPFDKIIKTRKEVVKNRQNYLSYPYAIFKLLEILGEEPYMRHFSQNLLKSTEKLYVQDRIWRAICAELDWPFTRTV
jgi:hypothetical protein